MRRQYDDQPGTVKMIGETGGLPGEVFIEVDGNRYWYDARGLVPETKDDVEVLGRVLPAEPRP